MTTEDWVYEAVQRSSSKGATIREVQRFIDEHHYEELAIDTIKQSLAKLELQQRLKCEAEHWKVSKQVSKEDAFKKLFGD